jgi:hypothetical protein
VGVGGAPGRSSIAASSACEISSRTRSPTSVRPGP